MAIAAEIDLDKYCADVASRAKQASARLAVVETDVKNRWLRRSAELLRENIRQIEQANARDLAAAPDYGLTRRANRSAAAHAEADRRDCRRARADRGTARPGR